VALLIWSADTLLFIHITELSTLRREASPEALQPSVIIHYRLSIYNCCRSAFR